MKLFLQLFAAITLSVAYHLFGRMGFPMAPVRLAATLSTTEILDDVLEAFKTRVPALNRLGIDFTKEPLKLNEPKTAHISGLPSASTYDATTGYANGATEANTMLTDITVTPDQHKHVPLKWDYLNLIADRKQKYDEVIRNAGYVLAKSIVDYCLALANSANFSQSSTYAVADSDVDMLNNICSDMNGVGAGNERTLLVNSDVASYLNADARLTSRDYAGQLQGGDAYRRWMNTHGFAEIIEYPDLPSNDTLKTATLATSADADDIIDTAAAHTFLAGQRVKFSSLTGGSNLDTSTIYYVISANLAAQTLQISTTLGGSAVDFGSNITAGTLVLAENLTGFAFDKRAMAVLCGSPGDNGSGLASALGITQVMGFEPMTDPDTGITLTLVKWQQPGTGDLYVSPTVIWGAVAGKQAHTASAGAITDYAGHRLISA